MSKVTSASTLSPKLPAGQKVCYSLGIVGYELINSFTASFLTLYYTDSVGLTGTFIATMMLVSRLLDGVSDIAMGAVIEKTRTRWGKARPWLLFGALPLALSLVLTMNIPGSWTIGGKQAYAYLTYIFMAVFCCTAVNLAYNAMLPRISLDRDDRNVTSIVRVIFSAGLTLILNVATPMALTALGGSRDQRAWTALSMIYALLSFLFLMITFFAVKERIPLDQEADGSYQKIPLKDSLKCVLGNKYFYIVLGINIIACFAVGSLGLGVFYTRDVMGNETYYGLMTAAMLLPMILVQPVLPPLVSRFGKKTVCIAAGGCIILSGLLTLVSPRSLPVYLASAILKGLGSAPLTGLSATLAADLVDYGEWKHGIRAEGFAFSTTSFGAKVGTGIGSAMVGWILALGRYEAALEVQTAETQQAFILANAAVPMLTGLVIVVLFLFWDYEKLYPTIQAEMAERRAAQEVR